MPRDEYYEMKDLAKQKAREADQAMRDSTVTPEKTPEEKVADQQQAALSLIRARPEYKEVYDKQLERYKKSDFGAALDLQRAFPRGALLGDTQFQGVGPESDQRRSFNRGGGANVEDLYAFTVGNLIGNNFRDSDTYTGWRTDKQGKREGVGAFWQTRSLADEASSPLAFILSNSPDVWAKNADPNAVRRLAQLEAYFTATKASGGYPDMDMAPESREDYKPPRLKMLEPRKK